MISIFCGGLVLGYGIRHTLDYLSTDEQFNRIEEKLNLIEGRLFK